VIEDTAAVDIAIVGAGPLGMALALALEGGPSLALIDSRAPGAWADDPRALALAHGSRQLLERLGAWNAAAASPIREIHVSQRGGFGRTRIAADDYGAPALGYVMRYRDLADALAARVQPASLLAPCNVEAVEVSERSATLTLTHAGATRRLKAKLIVHAEGMPAAGPEVKVRDYQQQAIIAEVRTRLPNGQRAWERFTPDGPLALLPLGESYAVVFTVPTEKAAALLALGDDGFLATLQAQFGRRLEFVACGPRASFPLTLRLRAQLTGPRQVWIGNSAQTLHPVSGQGFNLGLRDAWELADALLDQPDPGAPELLAGYARGRRLDRRGSIAFTDSLVRIFSNDLPPLRVARGLGLLALDLCPPLRHFIARRMIWGARAWP
jgi:2-octaprenyl-6-methoxyphenol hydroxylase